MLQHNFLMFLFCLKLFSGATNTTHFSRFLSTASSIFQIYPHFWISSHISLTPFCMTPCHAAFSLPPCSDPSLPCTLAPAPGNWSMVFCQLKLPPFPPKQALVAGVVLRASYFFVLKLTPPKSGILPRKPNFPCKKDCGAKGFVWGTERCSIAMLFIQFCVFCFW